MRELLLGGILDHGVFSNPSGPIRTDWWNTKWIPFVDNEQGDQLCVDLNPAKGGKKGQVIDWWHEKGAYKVVADSVGEWLAAVAKDLEKGTFVAIPSGW